MTLTIREVHDTWAILESVDSLSSRFRVREIDALVGVGGPILFGIEPSGLRHVLIPVPTETVVAEDRRSAGVQIRTHESIDDGVKRTYVDIVCTKPHLHELFSLIVSDMLRQLTLADRQPDRRCATVLNRWRELLDRGPRSEPGLQTITGLFGELTVLRRAAHVSAAALGAWVGPTGARHDFDSPRLSVEVKATLASQGRFVEISGHEQLAPTLDRPLFLVVVRLEEVKGDGEALADLVDDVTALGADALTLTQLLDRAGVGPDQLVATSNRRFIVRDHCCYRVGPAFPKITAESFAGSVLPPGVIALRYTIDLSGPSPEPMLAPEVNQMYEQIAAGV